MLTLALLVSIGLFAQQGPGHDKDRDGSKIGMLDEFSPEEQATLKTKKMTLGLDLTQSQQDKIYQIHLRNASERLAKMEEIKKERESGEWTRPSKEERFNHLNSRLDKQIAHKKEMKSLLNEEQFKKWERGAMRRGHMKKENRKERSKRSRK